MTHHFRVRLSRLVLDPDRGTPGELLIRLLDPNVVVTLAHLRRVIEVLECDLVLLRFELMYVLVVLDYVDLSDRSGSDDADGELGGRGRLNDVAHQRRPDSEIDNDVVGSGIGVALADGIQDCRAGELLG